MSDENRQALQERLPLGLPVYIEEAALTDDVGDWCLGLVGVVTGYSSGMCGASVWVQTVSMDLEQRVDFCDNVELIPAGVRPATREEWLAVFDKQSTGGPR